MNTLEVKLIQDDCLNSLKLLNDNSVDLFLTDPPYNIGEFMQDRSTNLHKMRDNFFVEAGWDNLDYESWLGNMDSFFKEMGRVTKTGGTALIFMSVIRIESIMKIAKKYKFYYKTTGIWHKTNPMPRNMNLHFINSTEVWIYFIKGKKTGIFNNQSKAIHDFIESSTTPKSEKKFGAHPTQKPESIIKHFVTILSNENDLICDPFMGSGTTGFVSVANKRNFIGIELSKEYFNISVDRIKSQANINSYIVEIKGEI